MMKNNPNVRSFAILMVICVIAFIFINACKRESYTIATTDDVNITGYLDKYPDKFSMMRQIVERSGTAGYLGAYGRYTLFTPTNDAVTAWLKGIGKANVSDLTVEQSKDMVKFHLLPDTVATNRFTDGKLPQITLYGQYLQTGAINDGGVSSYIVNKQAKISQSNVRLGNGIIHVIDHVLIPATLTTAQTIEASGRYKYFTQALKETGFYDSLNVASSAVKDTTRRLQTAIIESDSALVKAGYSSYEAFKAKFSKTGDPKNHNDSLWLYIAYHLSAGATYTPDIISSTTINTLAPKEVVTTKYINQKILLNDDEFNGVLEPGVEVNRTFSNITTANGVLHETKNLYAIKVRYPTAVFFDVCDQPELKANPIWRGRNGATSGTIPLFANGASTLAGLRVNNPAKATLPQYYDYAVSVFGQTRRVAYDDKLVLSLGLTNANRAIWVELKTPMLVKGKYKVWVCYSYNGSSPLCQVGVDVGTPDAQILPNLVDFRQSLTSSGMTDAGAALPSSDPLMLAQGFKRYLATTNDKDKNGNVGLIQPAVKNNWGSAVARLAGTVNITTTDRHWIRLTMVGGTEASGTGSGGTWLDMIQFIPENDDQNYPRFSPGKDGLIFQKP
ncbi:fasciclin domain-containing protein [Pedobacter jeongneungensis]|uniref:fasciclin domain-containing protein n=1 Tax=Pedobacter jeongneungensis TaxID=947309 RepID=UPI000A06E814|nr:fasciclin domain-containing protein [Pedobacter jeongneungensis]